MTTLALPPPASSLSLLKDRGLQKLAAILMLVTLLTSETVWGQLLDFVGADVAAFAEPVPPPAYSDREIAELVRLTVAPDRLADLTPDEALVRNEAIPFAGATTPSRPFRALSLVDTTGLTALRCLTQAVYYEAAYEPLGGRRAVAQVVLNRMRHPAFPKSVCGVVYQGVNRPVCQFSFTCDGSLHRRPAPAVWQEAEDVARAALAGYVEASVGYATHYHANYVSPYWAPKLVKISRIGAHIFYRWPGKWGMPSAFAGAYSGYEAIPAILPRALVRRSDTAGAKPGAAGSGDPARSYTASHLSQNASPENRADDDVGGRIDPSKGWAAEIPAPEDSYHSSRAIARQQSGEYDMPQKGDGN